MKRFGRRASRCLSVFLASGLILCGGVSLVNAEETTEQTSESVSQTENGAVSDKTTNETSTEDAAKEASENSGGTTVDANSLDSVENSMESTTTENNGSTTENGENEVINTDEENLTIDDNNVVSPDTMIQSIEYEVAEEYIEGVETYRKYLNFVVTIFAEEDITIWLPYYRASSIDISGSYQDYSENDIECDEYGFCDYNEIKVGGVNGLVTISWNEFADPFYVGDNQVYSAGHWISVFDANNNEEYREIDVYLPASELDLVRDTYPSLTYTYDESSGTLSFTTVLNSSGDSNYRPEVLLSIRDGEGELSCDTVNSNQQYEECFVVDQRVEKYTHSAAAKNMYVQHDDFISGELVITFDIEKPEFPLTVSTQIYSNTSNEAVMLTITEEDLANAPATVVLEGSGSDANSASNSEALAKTGAENVLAIVGVATTLIIIGILIPVVRRKEV